MIHSNLQEEPSKWKLRPHHTSGHPPERSQKQAALRRVTGWIGTGGTDSSVLLESFALHVFHPPK